MAKKKKSHFKRQWDCQCIFLKLVKNTKNCWQILCELTTSKSRQNVLFIFCVNTISSITECPKINKEVEGMFLFTFHLLFPTLLLYLQFLSVSAPPPCGIRPAPGQ